MSKEQASTKIGCGTVLIIVIVGLIFLGQLGASTVGVGK